MRPPIIIDDALFNDRVNRIITTNGDNDRAGVTLEEVADLIFTRRMRINPQAGEITAQRAAKPKKETLRGKAVDDLLG